jgi:hypothetical protein
LAEKKIAMEIEMMKKFTVVLNSKKARIQQLKEEVFFPFLSLSFLLFSLFSSFLHFFIF